MACIADFTNDELRRYQTVRDNYRAFRGHVSLKAETWLIGLFKRYGEETLNAAIDACFLRSWTEPNDLETVAELIRIYTKETVMKAATEHGKAAWKSPRSLEGWLKGTIRPKAMQQSNDVATSDRKPVPLIDQRDKHIYNEQQAMKWLYDHGRNSNDFFDYFDLGPWSEPAGLHMKPVRLFELKGEYR